MPALDRSLTGVALACGLSLTLAACDPAPQQRPPVVAPEAETARPVLAAAPSCALDPGPLPTVPARARRITDFGATPNDDRADDEAIAAALKALQPDEWLVFPPGRYIQAHSIRIETPGVTLWGPGAELHATNTEDHTLQLHADFARVYGFTLTAVTDIRRSLPEQARISVYRDPQEPGLQKGNVVRGVTIREGGTAATANSAGSVGILVHQATDFTIAENVVRRSLADGIHITGGSRHGRVVRNTVRETGDDLIAVVSYLGGGWQSRLQHDAAWRAEVQAGHAQVSDVFIGGNDVADAYAGRGISVVGGQRITVSGNTIANVSQGAGVLVAQEGGYATAGVRDVLVSGNRISRVQTERPPYLPAGEAFAELRRSVQWGTWRTGHAAIEVHAIQNAAGDTADAVRAQAIAIDNVQFIDNDVSGVATDAVRIGVDTAPALLRHITLSGNRLARVGGDAVKNLLSVPGQVYCEGNVLDGKAIRPAGCSGPPFTAEAAGPAGAAMDCSRLP